MMKRIYIIILPICAFAIGSFLFYWYEIRSSNIRKECDLVEVHEDARRAEQGLTEEEAKKITEECENKEDNKNDGVINWKCQATSRPAKPATEAKDFQRKATEDEFNLCLRENGLEK